MSMKSPSVTVSQVFFMQELQGLAKKPLFGKPRLPLASYLTLGWLVFEIGAILGCVYRDSQYEFEKLIANPPKPGDMLAFCRARAIGLVEAVTPSEDECIGLIFYRSEVARLGHPMPDSDQMKEFSGWLKKQNIDPEVANDWLQERFAEGCGYGLVYPDDTIRRWKEAHEPTKDNALIWRAAYLLGGVTEPDPPKQTWEERVRELKDVVHRYCEKYMPGLNLS
jgi:hypothetical protein